MGREPVQPAQEKQPGLRPGQARKVPARQEPLRVHQPLGFPLSPNTRLMFMFTSFQT